MNVTFIRKWRGSIEGNCPALYLLERPVLSMSEKLISSTIDRGAAHRTMRLPSGTYFIVQGWKLSPDERAGLQNVAPGEDAVKVPADVVQGIRVPRLSWDRGTAQVETAFRSVSRLTTRVVAGTVLIIQGWKLEPGMREQLQHVADDEDAVIVPIDVIAGIKLVPDQRSA